MAVGGHISNHYFSKTWTFCQMERFYCPLREISSEVLKHWMLFLQNSQQQQHKQVRKWSGRQWRYQWQRLVLWFRKERWAHPVCLSFFPHFPHHVLPPNVPRCFILFNETLISIITNNSLLTFYFHSQEEKVRKGKQLFLRHALVRNASQIFYIIIRSFLYFCKCKNNYNN